MEPQETIEVAAPSVEEAIILGLTRLGATRDEVVIEVLDKGRRGLLGIGARKARVRLTRRPPEVSVSKTKAVSAVKPVPPADAKPAKRKDVVRKPVRRSEKRSKPRSTASPSVAPPKTERERPSSAPSSPSRPVTTTAALDRQMVEQTVLDVAEHLLAGLRVQISLRWQDEESGERPTLWVSLRGRDADALVGPRAQTLDAVQYLFRTVTHRKIEGNFNLIVDADGYRQRRLRSLEALAHKMANQAVRTGRSVRLRPMPAYERRIIHMTLRKDNRVRTESSGSGAHRAITIIPVRKG